MAVVPKSVVSDPAAARLPATINNDFVPPTKPSPAASGAAGGGKTLCASIHDEVTQKQAHKVFPVVGGENFVCPKCETLAQDGHTKFLARWHPASRPPADQTLPGRPPATRQPQPQPHRHHGLNPCKRMKPTRTYPNHQPSHRPPVVLSVYVRRKVWAQSTSWTSGHKAPLSSCPAAN